MLAELGQLPISPCSEAWLVVKPVVPNEHMSQTVRPSDDLKSVTCSKGNLTEIESILRKLTTKILTALFNLLRLLIPKLHHTSTDQKDHEKSKPSKLP